MKPDEEEEWDQKPEVKEVVDPLVKKIVEAMEKYQGAVATEWRSEVWFYFDWIANEIVEQQGVSKGVAERTLRELCATGDVRSMKADGVNDQPEEPEIIRPSEWLKDQVDLTVSPPIWVFVSAFDAQYWLNKQSEASGRPSKELVPPPTKALGKRPRIRALLVKLFPDGVPDPAHCPRQELQGQLLKADPKLYPLDLKTLKAAIDEYNAAVDRKRQELLGNPIGSD